MNPKRILEEIEASPYPQGTIASGQLLNSGTSSYTVIPHDAPQTVVKIIRPNHCPFGLNVAEEFALIDQISHLTGKHFRLPRAFACGRNPDFISLERLGDAYGWGKTLPEEPAMIGRAFGEFSARLFHEFGLGHRDFCLNNSTRPQPGDSRIGIIDLASVGPIDRLEDIFSVPRHEHPDLCIAMAETIEAHGYRLDVDYITKRMERSDRQRLAFPVESSSMSYVQELLPRSQATIAALQEWRHQPAYRSPAPAPTLPHLTETRHKPVPLVFAMG